MVLVSHVILQEHVTKGWSNIMGRSPSWQVTSLPSLGPQTLRWRKYNDFMLSHDITRSPDQGVI